MWSLTSPGPDVRHTVTTCMGQLQAHVSVFTAGHGGRELNFHLLLRGSVMCSSGRCNITPQIYAYLHFHTHMHICPAHMSIQVAGTTISHWPQTRVGPLYWLYQLGLLIFR